MYGIHLQIKKVPNTVDLKPLSFEVIDSEKPLTGYCSCHSSWPLMLRFEDTLSTLPKVPLTLT